MSTTTYNLLKKLENLEETKEFSLDWTMEQQCKILKIYHLFCKKEPELLNLIYAHHDCDSWETIFRDSKREEKTKGVEIAIANLEEYLNHKDDKHKHKNENETKE
jgi:hypothetical protein